MEKKIRKILSALLVLAMVVSIVPALDLGIETSAAETEYVATDIVYEFVYDISPYRGTKVAFAPSNSPESSYEQITSVYETYPEKEGYVFAGWYTDLRNMLPLGTDVTSGGAYAKFVPSSLMQAKAQVSTDTVYTSDASNSALRFIAAVDSLAYNQIGFYLNKAGSSKTYIHASTKVYKSLSATIVGGDGVTPEYFGVPQDDDDSNGVEGYLFALTLNNVEDQSGEYTATPFWITDDGTLVDHVVSSEKSIEMGIAANVEAEKTTIEADYAWYTDGADTYTISTKEELVALANLSKTMNFSGKTVKLSADIDMRKSETTVTTSNFTSVCTLWTPIGTSSVPFAGTFDGCGYTVSGLYTNKSMGAYQGLFGVINGATVKNVNITESMFHAGAVGGYYIGSVAGHATASTVSHVYSNAFVWAGQMSGGILGHVEGTSSVSNCHYAGTMGAWNASTTAKQIFSGVVAESYGTLTVDNCLFTGSITGTFGSASYVGGIVAFAAYAMNLDMSYCLSAGDMMSDSTYYVDGSNGFAGGLIAACPNATVNTATTANLYVTSDCYTVDGTAMACQLRADRITSIGVVAREDILGSLAETNASSLDYTSTWRTVEDSTPELWAGTADTSWYNDTDTEFTLYDKADLMGFSVLSQTNTFSGKTVKLGADITFNEGNAEDWATTPPADTWNAIAQSNGDGFLGTFDGQGHTISGLYYSGNGYATLIGRMYSTGVLKNISVVNSYLKSTTGTESFHHSSGIIGRCNNGTTVSGVYTDAILVAEKSAGIIAFNDAGSVNMTNCWFDGTIDVTSVNNAGGMAGSLVNSKVHTITNCLFTGTMTGSGKSGGYYGGLVGIGPYSATVNASNCLVAGDMTAVTTGVVGSVIGNNPGGNASTFTSVYATSETHTNLAGAGSALSGFAGVTAVNKADILGDLATDVLTDFDFAATWEVREDDVPAIDTNTWYDPTSSTYVINTAEELLAFSVLQETNNFSGKTILLGADIVLNDGNAADWADNAPDNVWNPIGLGDASKSFEGTFDGQGHTISGLYYSSALYGGGLFVYTGSNATIKNLNLTNSYICSTHGAEWSTTGSIAAFVNGTDFINVYSDAIIDTNSGYTGGIGGRLQGNGGNFTNCEFAGTITGTGDYANYIGGIVGGHNPNAAGATAYTGCVFSGEITGNIYVGGLTGRSSGASGSTTDVDGCKSTGTVNAYNSSNASDAGGLFGLAEVSTLTISNTEVTGTVNATLGIGGGYIGMVTTAKVDIDNSTFTGEVKGGTKLAGFVGRTNTAGYTTTIENCTFNGTVTATATAESTVAGFVANVNNGNVTVKNSVTKGTLVAPGPYAAGAIAQIVNTSGITVDVENVISTADVQCTSSNAGGIIARIMGVNPSVTVKDCLAAATFSNDSWCTAQIIAHAQSNAATMSNNFFVQTTNSAAAGVEADVSGITTMPVKVSQTLMDYLVDCHEMGMLPDYDGFEDAGFVITDAADLYGLAVYNEVNGFSGKTATLGADITINEGDAADWLRNAPKYNWKPIGALTTSGTFAGTFDGQGHTISGLYCAYASGNSMGLFREITSTGTVKNFKLVNSHFENTVEANYGYNAAIASYLTGGTISQVYTDAYVVTIDSYAGGIVGATSGATATVTECQFDGLLMARCVLEGGCGLTSGTSRAHANWVGGIVGFGGASTATVISDCVFSGKIMNECHSSHRTGGIMGANEKGTVTITNCFSYGELGTFNHPDNSYHFSMIMDGRGAAGVPSNETTLYDCNYVLATPAYNASGDTINSGSNIAGINGGNVSTVRYTMAEMIAKIESDYAAGTSPLDYTNVWQFNADALPTLRFGDTQGETSLYYITTDDGDQILTMAMAEESYDSFVDMTIQETETGSTYTTTINSEEVTLPYYYLTQVNSAAVDFKDIFYGAGTYLTKYTGTTLADAQALVTDMKAAGFDEYVSSNLNADCYYTALTFGDNVYAVTHFVHTGETYVSSSNEQTLSPYMQSDYYKTAVNTAGGEPSGTYDDVTITSVSLCNGGDAFIIRLKNGHYIVIDGGTNNQTDRDAVAAALGASADEYTAGTKNNPRVVVDAWFFTHAHADHVGLFRGGIYGAIQVDVYVKGFYYNFTEKWHVDETFSIGSSTVDGYVNLAYAYADQDSSGTNYYKKGTGDTAEWWLEYTATTKTASNVNNPTWDGSSSDQDIPVYRVQAGQKFYFDGMTVEVPYTQEQVQPSEINLDLNGTCSWFLLTDDYGHTFLDAGDAEKFNAVAVTNLYSSEYEIYGADVGKLFHHGLNSLINFTGTFGETPGSNTVSHYDYSLVDDFYGVDTTVGDGKQTQFVFITKNTTAWTQISGYNSCGGSQRDLSIHEMYYLFGYILTSTYNTPIRYYHTQGYATVDTRIPFAAYGGELTNVDGYTDTFEGTTTVTMNSSGITWDKYHTTGIYG